MQITGWQSHITDRYGTGAPLLFPRATKNPDGAASMSSGTYRGVHALMAAFAGKQAIVDEKAARIAVTEAGHD